MLMLKQKSISSALAADDYGDTAAALRALAAALLGQYMFDICQKATLMIISNAADKS